MGVDGRRESDATDAGSGPGEESLDAVLSAIAGRKAGRQRLPLLLCCGKDCGEDFPFRRIRNSVGFRIPRDGASTSLRGQKCPFLCRRFSEQRLE